MRRVHFDQGSKDWHLWRSCGLGASDAAAIVNVSPWQTRQGLLNHKVSHRFARDRTTDKNKSEAMLRGTAMEPEAREAFCKAVGVLVTPACVIHDDLDWMRASLDGLSDDDTVAVEIKCVNQDDHQSALSDMVPTKYWPQVQHQLLVTGLPKMYYWSFSKSSRFKDLDKQALVVVRPDKAYQAYLLEEEEKFWKDFLEKSSIRG